MRQAWAEYAATRSTPPDARDRAIWQRFVGPALGDRPVAELTTRELEYWLAAQISAYGVRHASRDPRVDERERRRRAQYTANRRFNLLRAILNSAYRKDPQRVPTPDAWRRVRTFQRVDRPRTRALTAAESRRLLGVMPAALRELARGALCTGYRLGELQALRVGDVCGACVHVRLSKAGRDRFVPLTIEGAGFFGERAQGRAADELLFSPLTKIGISRGMRAACDAAGITPRATFHDLRRTYGSLLLNSGAPIHVVQELLGHADLKTTRRVYAHLTRRTLEREVEAHLPSFCARDRGTAQ